MISITMLSCREAKERKLERTRQWRLRNKEKIKQYKKNIPKHHIKEISRRFYLKHRERLLEKARKYHIKNKQRDNERCLKNYYKSKERTRNYGCKCIGCGIIMGAVTKLVCEWCIQNYPHKYLKLDIQHGLQR